MSRSRTTNRALGLLVLLSGTALPAQSPAQVPTQSQGVADPSNPTPTPHKPRPATPKSPVVNMNLILLDPAHGGADNGAALPGNTTEKEVTLSLANHLRPLLSAQGFTVVLTRENPADDVTADARVELANRSHPLACILLHATAGGHGLHLYTSSLAPPASVSPPDDFTPITPWDTAQAPLVPQSLRLVSDLATALNGIRAGLLTARASVSPIDSLTCPAVALEIAPLAASGDINTPVSDSAYQQHVAEAVTQALVYWRTQAVAAAAAAQAAKDKAAPTSPTAPKPAPRPKPKPIVPPVEVPDVISVPAPVHKPAPIVRVPPPDSQAVPQ